MKAALRGVLATVCLTGIGVAAAAEPLGNVDLYYVASSKLKLQDETGDGATFSGHGYGVRGGAWIAPAVFIDGQYQQTRNDRSGVHLDLDDLRLGAGVRLPNTPFYGQAEYVNLKGHADFPDPNAGSNSGFGVHVGASLRLDAMSLTAEAGYLSVGNAGSGLEYLAGGGYDLTQDWSLFADYRVTELKKHDIKLKPQDARVGLRFNFR